MSAGTARDLAIVVLVIHLGIIAFNVVGLIMIPWGGIRGWSFIGNFWLRLIHLVSLSIVVLQALLGQACFLTLWQAQLSVHAAKVGAPAPLIAHWIDGFVFWSIPLWVFTLIYAAVWIYVVALWWIFPPRRP